MKYLVMECHTGFAVLMDEESRFHKAANMHYTVGQTVTDPVLLTEDRGITVKRNTVMKIAAAAACLLMISGVGIRYYLTHRTAESVVMVIEETQYEMQLNRSGEVIRVLSSSGGQTVEEKFDVKPKSAADTVNALLKIQKDAKDLSDGDTVEIIIEADNDSTLEACKSELRSEAAKLHLNADVQERGKEKTTEPPAKETTEKTTETTAAVTAAEKTVVSEKAKTEPAVRKGTEPTLPEPPTGHTVPHPEATAPNPPENNKPEPGNTLKHTLPDPANNNGKPGQEVRPGGETTMTEPAKPAVTEPQKPADDPVLPDPENDRKPVDPKENAQKPAEENPADKPRESQWKRTQSPPTPPHPETGMPAEPGKPEEPGIVQEPGAEPAHLPVREDGERILPEKPAAVPTMEMVRAEEPAKPDEPVKPDENDKPEETGKPEEPAAGAEKPEQPEAPAIGQEQPEETAELPVRPDQQEHPAEPNIIDKKP